METFCQFLSLRTPKNSVSAICVVKRQNWKRRTIFLLTCDCMCTIECTKLCVIPLRTTSYHIYARDFVDVYFAFEPARFTAYVTTFDQRYCIANVFKLPRFVIWCPFSSLLFSNSFWDCLCTLVVCAVPHICLDTLRETFTVFVHVWHATYSYTLSKQTYTCSSAVCLYTCLSPLLYSDFVVV